MPSNSRQVPIDPRLLIMPQGNSGEIKLRGSKCKTCGEVFFGQFSSCENCGGTNIEEMSLSTKGKLYTYTVMKNRPPGNYRGPDPFVPYGVGLVELPDGCRLMAPLTVSEGFKVGMALELVVDKLYSDAEGNDVMAFKFKPAGR